MVRLERFSDVCCRAEAVGNIISFLGMQPCERSDKVPENKNSHVLFLAGACLTWARVVALTLLCAHSDVSLLSGVFRGGHDVLVRARLALADGVTMRVSVRSSEETVGDIILASVG